MKILILVLILSSTILLSFSFNNNINKDEIAYPEGYRKWTHIKTAIIDSQSRAFPRFGGFHHIYANDIAVSGTPGKFPDGSVFVFDVLEAIRKPGEIVEGNRRMIDVMVKDSKRFSSTGGWGFEEFKGDSKTERTLTAAMITQCVNCHSTKSNNDYIFSVQAQITPVK